MQRAGSSGWEATGHRRASEFRLAPALSLLFLPLSFLYPQFKALLHQFARHRKFVKALRQYSTSAVQHHIRVREQIRLPKTVSKRILSKIYLPMSELQDFVTALRQYFPAPASIRDKE